MIKFFVQIALISFNGVSAYDRMKYFLNSLMGIVPIAIVMDMVNWWFKENQQFGKFMCISLLLNLAVGAVMHFLNRTFSIKLFIYKNIEMAFVVVVVYVMLEMLRYTAGGNIAGEIFKVTIQIMTLLYPTSKVLKNIFILTKGKYPPEFVMKRLYNFEKNGDLSNIFTNSKDNPENHYEEFFKEVTKKEEEIK